MHPNTVDPVAGLIEIPMPGEVSLWPQTWESRLALGILVVAMIATLWRVVQTRSTNRYRREALAELARIEHAEQDSQSEKLTWLALLVRRTALYAFPRQEVAKLSGQSWLDFLDRSYGGHEFSDGVGRVLALGPYRHPPTTDVDLEPLLALTERWIRGHHA